MTHNIDTVHYIGDGRLHIRRGTANGLLAAFENDLAEGNFLDQLRYDDKLDGDIEEMVMISDTCFWTNQCSGSGWDFLLTLLKETEGFAELAFVWEGGEWFTGLEVRNGICTEKDVKLSLVKQK